MGGAGITGETIYVDCGYNIMGHLKPFLEWHFNLQSLALPRCESNLRSLSPIARYGSQHRFVAKASNFLAPLQQISALVAQNRPT